MKGDTMHYQRGAGLIGWLIILIFVGVLALITIRVVPVYLEAYYVRSVLKSLQNDRTVAEWDRNAAWQSLQKRFEVNNIRSVGRDDVNIQKGPGGTEIVVAYETRFPLIGNIDGIANFTSKVTVSR